MNINDIDYNKEYYDILGVPKDASKDDIKKAFRKASLKWHPDRHANDSDEEKKIAEEKFKEVNEAYTILSDDNLRQAYDAGPDINIDQSPFDPFGMFNHSRQASQQEQRQVIVMNVSYEDICNGVDKDITYERTEICDECHGTGGDDIETCPECGGRGVKIVTKQNTFGVTSMMSECPRCHGTGKIIKKPCKKCHGTGLQTKKNTIHIKLSTKELIYDGAGIYVGNYGNINKHGVPSQLIIVIRHVLPDGMKIQGDQWSGGAKIYHFVGVPYYDMILGSKVTVLTPSGKQIAIKIPENCVDGKQLVARKQGFFGDDYVVIPKTTMPKANDKQKDLLKEIRKTYEVS